MSSHVVSDQAIASQSAVSSVMQAIGALTFGVIIVFAVGFMPVDAAHNAAHDTRHSLAFPCH